MNTNIKLLVVLIAGLAVGGGATWYTLRAQSPAGKPEMAKEMAKDTAPAKADKAVLYWYDPMVPAQHFDKPGKSPFMDMDLVPKYAGDSADGNAAGVSIDPRVVQNLGIRSTIAEKGRLWRRIDTVGYVRADDNRIEVLQARVNGWVEALHVRAVNDPVQRGQLIAEVYSPDLYVAQEEFLLALKHPEDAGWIAAARQKMAFLGLTQSQIGNLEKGGKPLRRVNYYAPASGIVSRLAVHEGGAINTGMPILEITDLSKIWVTAEVMENQAAWIAPGKSVEISVDSLPGETFEGKVDYLYPTINANTRTHPVRIVLANKGLKLKPGMFAKVTLYGGKGEEAVLVPSEAVITTGKRSIVLVAQGEGHFLPVAVKTGMESDGRTAILIGLKGGEKVVTSGQFLIESEANLKGALDKLGAPGVTVPEIHTGSGRITKVNAQTGELEIQHEPIPSLDWPGMTMEFEVKDQAILKGLKPGQQVEFDLRNEDGDFPVVAIRPKAAAKPTAGAK
ncbi:MAG: efflux RND transporter periplasmic adaptor subunit [Gallionellaceae bacterium]|nr:efflux RND transporter periplasmic adaptor subunit [Gallionellaceae bacterium]